MMRIANGDRLVISFRRELDDEYVNDIRLDLIKVVRMSLFCEDELFDREAVATVLELLCEMCDERPFPYASSRFFGGSIG